MKTLKCAWCGSVQPLGPKGRPKQHKNGKTTCVGSGQQARVHMIIKPQEFGRTK